MSQLERPCASGSRLGSYRALGVATRDGFLLADLNHQSLGDDDGADDGEGGRL